MRSTRSPIRARRCSSRLSVSWRTKRGRDADFALYQMVERLAPAAIAEERRIYKGVSVNVDFYSGFVYSMLGLPPELYTPVFAIARIVGWSAHRLEEAGQYGQDHPSGIPLRA